MPDMADTIGYSQACEMLHAAVAEIRAQHEMLSRLDSAVGDGDHGTTMLRAMEAVAKTVSENQGAEYFRRTGQRPGFRMERMLMIYKKG